jgi:hypothetical protein
MDLRWRLHFIRQRRGKEEVQIVAILLAILNFWRWLKPMGEIQLKNKLQYSLHYCISIYVPQYLSHVYGSNSDTNAANYWLPFRKINDL